MSTQSKFEANVCPEPNTGCLLWTGAADPNGYGRVRYNGNARLAHRVAWELAHGAPGKLCVLHRCDTPACVNPAHLFLGTQLDNIADATQKGRVARGEHNGARTHPEQRARGEHNGHAKLAEADVRAIRSAYAVGGTTVRKLADAFSVSYGLVSLIIRRERWAHV